MSGLSFLLLLLAPPVLGVLFGLVQLAAYAVLVKAGRRTWEQVPFFPVLWLRGMTAVVVLGAATAIWFHTR